MDFTAVIQMAKQNREKTKDEGKYYQTKLAPLKKETKEARRLSANIQKFLLKREQEEKQKELEQKRKVAHLLAMRDEKSKNKIRKMLKVTKSANKSVLDDANATVTQDCSDQLDQDDYGYVSTEANAFYQKYIEKVKDVKEDKGFAPSRPQSLKDLTGTKERVKAAISRDKDEKINGQRKIKSYMENSNSTSNKSTSDGKILYDPEKERKDEEKKHEDEKKKLKVRRILPPPMDFRELLKLAEKKQHEPIEIVQEVKKEPERLLTSKEKRELEEQRRAKESRQRREHEKKEERTSSNNSAESVNNKSSVSSSSKLKPITANKIHNNRRLPSNGVSFKKPSSTGSLSSLSSTSTVASKSVKSEKVSNTTTKPLNGISKTNSTTAPLKSMEKSNSMSKTHSVKNHSQSKSSYNGITREFPPKLSNNNTNSSRNNKMGSVKTDDSNKSRHNVSMNVGRIPSSNNKAAVYKRQILDDDDDEYDSEMDDFIDDGEDEQDYSSVIKDIFGYDKSKYCNYDDDDDTAGMESNFAQVQREEYISKKLGLQEDLEDMRLEALEKERKRKMMKKRKL